MCEQFVGEYGLGKQEGGGSMYRYKSNHPTGLETMERLCDTLSITGEEVEFSFWLPCPTDSRLPHVLPGLAPTFGLCTWTG